MDILKESNGWHSDTLTEDIEFSIENIIRGHKISWAQDAIIFDEQPLKFNASCRQRLRWSVGHIQCFQKFFGTMIRKKEKNATLLDAMIYTLGMPMMLVSLVVTLIDISKIIFFEKFTILSLLGGLKFSIITILISIIQAISITILENKNIKKVWKGIATYPIFLISWVLINVVAFFKANLEWKPINHIGSGELKEET